MPAHLGAALKAYEFLVSYLSKHKVESMKAELEVAREMAELLPHKITRAMRAAAGS